MAPATSVYRVSKAQTSKVVATSNLKRRPGLASPRRQADDKTPSTAKQGGRPPTSRGNNLNSYFALPYSYFTEVLLEFILFDTYNLRYSAHFILILPDATEMHRM